MSSSAADSTKKLRADFPRSLFKNPWMATNSTAVPSAGSFHPTPCKFTLDIVAIIASGLRHGSPPASRSPH